MDILTYVLLGICIVLSGISIFVAIKSKSETKLEDRDKAEIINSFNNSISVISKSLSDTQIANNEKNLETLNALKENLTKSTDGLEKRVFAFTEQLNKRMEDIRADNSKQLDRMRETVDEKLSKTINERFDQSFKVLSEQLENVYKSIGEMQNIASDVGSLTKMLSNVKTTGIFGEIQLGAILEQVLAKEQYETNFVTADGKDPVEFAIKFPGQAESEYVYMPIDSKFPYTIYIDLQNAYESNDFELVKQKKELLKTTIKNMARDINVKYIYPPKTTPFAVMFLPIEGLFAEVAKMGLIEELQEKFNVTIAGPTTMMALLNSFQMGFRTLAIQKKSGEVWKILGAVKTEFDKFNGLVEKIQKQFDSTSRDFDTLVGTRSRMISSKLKAVEKLDTDEAVKVLGFDDETEEEE